MQNAADRGYVKQMQCMLKRRSSTYSILWRQNRITTESTPVLINGKSHHECCLYQSTPRYHNLPKTLWDPTRMKMQTEIPSRITSMLWKQKIFSLAQTCVIRCSTPCKLSHYSSWVQGMTLLSVLTGGIPFDKILYWTLGTAIRLLTHVSA